MQRDILRDALRDITAMAWSEEHSQKTIALIAEKALDRIEWEHYRVKED